MSLDEGGFANSTVADEDTLERWDLCLNVHDGKDKIQYFAKRGGESKSDTKKSFSAKKYVRDIATLSRRAMCC